MDGKSFQILAALAAEPRHGYAIRQEVESRTDGRIRLWPATLYGTLADLSERGWIIEVPSPVGAGDDPRRRYYALTQDGRQALTDEAERLETLAGLARERLAAGEARS
ncbi:MAG TPA: PadR family transcriptional regulator [Alphaproteobacteria bacterium]|nr:PadR family transcriptional regulator [Alphaproteobacteria bacterium]